MNKKTKILLGILILLIVILVIVGGILLLNKNEANNSFNVSSADDMGDLITELYSGLEGRLPTSLNSMEIDIKNIELVKTYTGLDNVDGIEHIVVSEPIISSQAYSLILVKSDSKEKADEIAKNMNEKVDTNKWISVSAEKVYSTSNGDLTILVMSSEEWAKPVYDRFKELAGTTGNEYERNGV